LDCDNSESGILTQTLSQIVVGLIMKKLLGILVLADEESGILFT